MSTDNQLTYQLSIGQYVDQHQVTHMLANAWLILYQHLAKTMLICIGQLLLLSSIFFTQILDIQNIK